jgi:hypothetical protein
LGTLLGVDDWAGRAGADNLLCRFASSDSLSSSLKLTGIDLDAAGPDDAAAAGDAADRAIGAAGPS